MAKKTKHAVAIGGHKSYIFPTNCVYIKAKIGNVANNMLHSKIIMQLKKQKTKS